MIEHVIARLEAEIPELANRTFGEANFAELRRKGKAPHATPCAHILPLGFQGGQADAMSGAFTQIMRETIGVILTLRDQGAIGKRIMGDVRGFVMQIVNAIAGWAPPGAMGVFALTRGQLVSADGGTFQFQIDFSINDQLRIL